MKFKIDISCKTFTLHVRKLDQHNLNKFSTKYLVWNFRGNVDFWSAEFFIDFLVCMLDVLIFTFTQFSGKKSVSFGSFSMIHRLSMVF
jgi:hypothetical protein